MFERYGLLDLVVFSTNPWIVLIPICVELCQGAQAFFVVPMVDEPTGRLSTG